MYPFWGKKIILESGTQQHYPSVWHYYPYMVAGILLGVYFLKV